MATNTNGITTFGDTAFGSIDVTNPTQSGNEIGIAYVLRLIFLTLGKEFPSDATTDDMKLLGQECPTKDEIEVWLESFTTANANAYINNASSYASNQLIKYSDLRYEEIVEDSITITPTYLTIPGTGSTDTNNVTVTCPGSGTASTTSSGIILSKTSGIGNGTLTVSAKQNTATTDIRIGSVIFKSGSQTCKLEVTQTEAPTVK